MKDKRQSIDEYVSRFGMVLIACLWMLFISLDANAQKNKVTLKLNDQAIEQALNSIESQTPYRFLFNKQQVDVNRKVTINSSNQELTSVLAQILKGTDIEYKIEGNQIILSKKNSNPETADAKSVIVKGVVKDENGDPLIGATVMVKNTNNGTITDIEGKFSLDARLNSPIEVSYVGYQKQTIAAKPNSQLLLTLTPTTELHEVVVIGYGTASKRDMAGSITKVSGEDIINRPNSNPVASLQGKVANLSVVNSGKLNEGPDVRIRSTISLANTSPLYIIDGIMNDNMSMVSSSEIESMEILKDPSSLAIFGVRGANGVIIITTKKGKDGKLSLSFNSSIGIKSIVNAPKMANRDEFIELYNEQQFNNGSEAYTKYDLYKANTNWVDVIKEPSPVVFRGNINLSHGSEKNKFYLGLNYIQEKGLISYERFKKIGITANDELIVSERFKCGFGFNGYVASLPQNHNFQSALKAPPIVEPYNSDTKQYNRLPEGIGGNDIENPLLSVEGKKYSSVASEYNFVPNIFFEVNLFRKLIFRTNYYLNFYTKQQRDYSPHTAVYNMENKKSEITNDLTSVAQFSSQNIKFQQEYLLTYKNSFNNHNLTILGGLTTDAENYTDMRASVSQYSDGAAIPYDKRWWYASVFPYGDPTSYKIGTDQYVKRTVSYLFRTLYNYDGKYIVNASFRRDGSTAISKSHRFQDFWALGAAWLMTQEKFMKKQNLLNNLKLKASIGQLGNQFTGPNPLYRYLYYSTYESGTSAVFGDKTVFALKLPFHADENIRWETVTSYETGFEADLLKSRLHLEASYYYRKTKDLLTIITNQITGDKYGVNAGSVRAKGIEFMASWSGKTLNNQLNYSLSGNISTINNKVLTVWEKGYKYINGRGQVITEAGHPIGRFVGYKVDGIYQDMDEISNGPDVSSIGISPGPGDLKFKDISGPEGKPDGKLDDYDKTTIGNPTPDFTYGLSANVSFKGFDLSVDLQGVQGNEVWRDWGNEGAGVNIYNFRVARLNRWKGLNTSNSEPREYTKLAWNNLQSSYFIEDGSYLRIRNIELGYSLPASFTKKMNLVSFRLFLSAQNLKTWKHNSGFTPEAGGEALQFGIDDGGYPIPAIYTTGLNLTF
jgi:TonB-linked SusC/RagA family outer membrane protein